MDTPYSLDFPKMDSFTFNNDYNSEPLVSPDKNPNWWKTCTVYQIWPASFKDGNGDGLGDLPGIISKLDYLKDLGIDCIWLSPMYASPQIDMGYDISDYNAIYPPYGSMDDMDALIVGLHQRGMKIVLDLVVNHTSDQHEWFKESRKSKQGECAEWYIWKDPKWIIENGKKQRRPPNNWGGRFGGSAWEFVPERGQYYLHLFAREQPDLNWENPETRRAIHESALCFWFRKGIDGFRVDTGNLYSKVQTFPDGVVDPKSRMTPYADPEPYVRNGPRIHEFYQEIRREVLDEFGDPMMVGELSGCTIEQILEYVSCDRRELSMVFDFDFVAVWGLWRPWHEISGKGYTVPEMKAALRKTQDLVNNTKAWSSMFGENHDLPRSVDRLGSREENYWAKACKVLAMMLGTLSGTLFVYQGEEIGMTNIPMSWGIDDVKDLNSINYYNKIKEEHPGDREILKKAWEGIVKFGRDNARTPVQWDSTEYAGFSTQKPWMRVNDNYKKINVAAQLHDKHSVRSFWKRIIKLRKEHSDLFIQGAYHVHDLKDLNTFTFEKTATDGKKALVMLNFSDEEQAFRLPKGFERKNMRCLISNEEKTGTKLGAWEGRVYIEDEDE
jgi:oligo-1,6-glucosidase